MNDFVEKVATQVMPEAVVTFLEWFTETILAPFGVICSYIPVGFC